MEVVGANSEMMFCVKVFGEIIRKILLAGMPHNAKVAPVNLISNPKKILFHRSGPLSFNRAVCDGNRRAVVTVDRCSWLRVPEFVEGEAQYGGILAVAEEGAKFSLRGGGDDKLAYSSRHMDGTVELYGMSVDG